MDLFPKIWDDEEKKAKKPKKPLFLYKIPFVFWGFRGDTTPRPQNEALGEEGEERGAVFKPLKVEFEQIRELQPPNPPFSPPGTETLSKILIFS